MNSSKSIRNTISFLAWVGLFIIAILAPKFFDYAWWSFLAGSLPFLIKLSYDHFDWINLFINRLILNLTNKTVSWDMKVRYEGETSVEVIEDIIRSWKKIYSLNILQSGDYDKVVSIEEFGATIKISISRVRKDEDEFVSELIISIQRMHVPFQHSTKTLNAIIKLIENAKNQIEFENERYDFKAVFLDANPYLGMFLKRLKVSEDTFINVDFSEDEGSAQAKVSVNKNKVSLVTSNLHSLQIFSKKYITLSSLNLSDV